MPKFFPAFLTSFIHSTENNKNTHIFADFIEGKAKNSRNPLRLRSLCSVGRFQFRLFPFSQGCPSDPIDTAKFVSCLTGFVTASTNTGAAEQRSGVVFFAYRLILRVLS